MKIAFFAVTFFSVVIFSCHNPSTYPGFTSVTETTWYRLHKIGEDTVKAKPGDFILVNLEYSTIRDSVFFKGTRKLQLDSAVYPGSIEACFARLAKGDSATFILDASGFFLRTLGMSIPRYIHAGDPVKINVGMADIQTQADYEREKEAFLSWTEDFGEYEKIILKDFIRSHKPGISPLPSGVYFIPVKEGKGKKIEAGDTVTLNYEGRFLNGRFFDSTVKRNQPFQFVYGTEWQVVKGLEEAIGLMHEGERALVILPSGLAFGNTGSSTGIIPPFTSLIFEVEILKVSSSGKI
jgi:FKBP-type peptidyl-prolyl cis-trans isomerase FkpA